MDFFINHSAPRPNQFKWVLVKRPVFFWFFCLRADCDRPLRAPFCVFRLLRVGLRLWVSCLGGVPCGFLRFVWLGFRAFGLVLLRCRLLSGVLLLAFLRPPLWLLAVLRALTRRFGLRCVALVVCCGCFRRRLFLAPVVPRWLLGRALWFGFWRLPVAVLWFFPVVRVRRLWFLVRLGWLAAALVPGRRRLWRLAWGFRFWFGSAPWLLLPGCGLWLASRVGGWPKGHQLR